MTVQHFCGLNCRNERARQNRDLRGRIDIEGGARFPENRPCFVRLNQREPPGGALDDARVAMGLACCSALLQANIYDRKAVVTSKRLLSI
jgi:hypothetical protein